MIKERTLLRDDVVFDFANRRDDRWTLFETSTSTAAHLVNQFADFDTFLKTFLSTMVIHAFNTGLVRLADKTLIDLFGPANTIIEVSNVEVEFYYDTGRVDAVWKKFLYPEDYSYKELTGDIYGVIMDAVKVSAIELELTNGAFARKQAREYNCTVAGRMKREV